MLTGLQEITETRESKNKHECVDKSIIRNIVSMARENDIFNTHYENIVSSSTEHMLAWCIPNVIVLSQPFITALHIFSA